VVKEEEEVEKEGQEDHGEVYYACDRRSNVNEVYSGGGGAWG